MKAQQSRWMFLSKARDGGIILVDTLQDDIKQVDQFEGHENVVFFWINNYKKVKTAKGSYVITEIMKFAVDTSNKQIESTSYTKYKNNVTVRTPPTFDEWADVIPGSQGELLIKFARSINNENIKVNLIMNAILNYNPYTQDKSVKKK